MRESPSNSDDVIDVRNVIDRVEDLESIEGIEDKIENLVEDDDAIELVALRELLGDLCGNGGDHEWKGDWYPVTLIRDSYFKTYAQEFAEDIGAINREASWPNNCIDWDQASRELQMDYSTVEFDRVTFWYR